MKQTKKTLKNKWFQDIGQITFLEAHINYTMIHFEDGSKKIHAYPLKRYENLLGQNLAFSRIHRKYIVNKDFIQTSSNYSVKLSCGRVLPVARRRKV